MGKHFLKSLKVKNFRGIKTSKIDDFARVNLFVGKNSCGKTTVLESLFLLAAISDPREIIKFQNFRGVYLSEPRDWADFFFEQKYEGNLYFAGVQKSGERELTVSALYEGSRFIQTGGHKGDGTDIIKANNIQSRIDDYLYGLEYNFSVSYDKGQTPNKYNSKVVTTLDPSTQSIKFEPHIDKEYKEEFFNNAGLIRMKDSYVYTLVARMLQEKRKDVLLENLKIIEPRVEDIQIGPAIVFADIGLKSFIPLNLLGDGLIYMLGIVSYIDYNRNGILMIDEIGAGLHVSCIEHIWKILIEQSRKLDTQIFMTTHSKDVVEGLAGLHEREPDLFSEDGDDVACFYLDKDGENQVRGYRFSPEDLKHLMESDTDVRL